MSKKRDTVDTLPGGLEPLNARSLALSALLGTHPPRLPARSLVALGELFGIAPGTTRTALSRLVASGDVDATDGWYTLAGRLLDRQRAQDSGRRPARRGWDRRWHTVITLDSQRSLAVRRQFRRTMVDHRFAELRPDIWMRPANLPAPPPEEGRVTTSGPIDRSEPERLARRLWNLDELAATALDLERALDAITELDGEHSIPQRFSTAAAVLRFLRAEPLLPPEIVGTDWPVDRLRDRYAETEAALQRDLRSFFRATLGA